MAKEKGSKGVQNRHIYSRASYLYQAATYLASQQNQKANISEQSQTTNDEHSISHQAARQQKAMQNMSRQLVSSLKSVTLKAQIRQAADMKRTICKFCDTLQIEGQTCSSTVENLSRGGLKPWADVLVIRCNTCKRAKRYPVSAPRQKRRALREQNETKEPASEEGEISSTSAT